MDTSRTLLRSAAAQGLLAACIAAAVPAQAVEHDTLAAVLTSAQVCSASCASTEFTESVERASWRGDGLDLGASVDSGALPFGRNEAHAGTDFATGTYRLRATVDGVTPGTWVSGLSKAWLGDTLQVLNPDGTPYTGGGESTLTLDITGSLSASAGSGLFAGI